MPNPQRSFLLISLLGAVLASLLLIPGLDGGFVFDDGSNIVNNPGVHMETLDADSLYQVLFGPQPGGITRILPTLSFALDYWRGGGLHPAVFKATNIAIHALTTVVLAFFFRLLLAQARWPQRKASIGALAMALTWAIHPLQVSSVLYSVQRMQTMCTLFTVLALYTYLKARQAQIEDRIGRTGLMLTGLLWAISFGCKEDAILLPAYTLALELTVLHFGAASPQLARTLRKGYLYAFAAGAATFLLVVVPYYWHSTDYAGRDFSSDERLLTQGRVLCMYLWQLLLPLPQHMPFYYDWLQPSRGLLHPWTTLPALLLVLALLATAWRLRARRPLFALGVFLFFAGHFITSNIVGLELAFEHRNHFPLIGIVLAIGDLLVLAAQHLRIRPAVSALACALLLVLLGSATAVRARIWNNPLELARKSTESAPGSARAWNSLCLGYFEMGGGHSQGSRNSYLDKAIDTCSQGAEATSYSDSSLTNLVIFKTIKGNVTQTDWNRYLARLRQVPMSPENRQALQTLINNISHGVKLDENRVFEAIDIMAQRGNLKSVEFAAVGYFILSETRQPDRAYPYLARSVETAPANSTLPGEMIAEMKQQGRSDWALKLEALANAEGKLNAPQ